MRSFILVTVILAAMTAEICSRPSFNDKFDDKEYVKKTREEANEEARKACDNTYKTIKSEPSAAAFRKIFEHMDDTSRLDKPQGYVDVFRNIIRVCTYFNATESAPEAKHLNSIMASLKSEKTVVV